MDEQELLGYGTKQTEYLMEKIKRKLAKQLEIKDIRIANTQILRETNPIFGKSLERVFIPREELRNNYEELLAGKVIEPQMQNRIIEYAELTMQPYTYCDLEAHSKRGQEFTLKIMCCLPEHGQLFANYWIGRRVELDKLDGEVQNFAKEMKEHNISNVIIEQQPTDSEMITITNIKTRFTFA